MAANMLMLQNKKGEHILVMSQTAKNALAPEKLSILENSYKVITPDIPTFEKYGGGSARCMMAEIF